MRIPEDEPDCYTAFSNDQKIVPVLHKELERKYCMLVCARTGAVKIHQSYCLSVIFSEPNIGGRHNKFLAPKRELI